MWVLAISIAAGVGLGWLIIHDMNTAKSANDNRIEACLFIGDADVDTTGWYRGCRIRGKQ